MNNNSDIITPLLSELQSIDFDALAISDYNKKYIRNIKAALPYYLSIYQDCLSKALKGKHKELSNITLIDFGGGSGFLSIFAKKAGIGQVIYIDLNSKSVHTVQVLKDKYGIGPDIILEGSSLELAEWCKENKVKPDLLIATDLIEHIYNLSPFFADLHLINDEMDMVFTTASNPFNYIKNKKLRKYMSGAEDGSLETPNYLTLRQEYIKKEFPKLTESQVKEYAFLSKGMIYEDISKAIENNYFPTLKDKYNTCDPRTGNWVERILSINDYKEIIKPYNYQLKVFKGFYNSEKANPILKFIVKTVNRLIKLSGKAGIYISPFIILYIKKKRS